jgi:uncharacterized protein (TIGR02284 family)
MMGTDYSTTNAATEADTASLNEMIEVLNDGQTFYSDSANEVRRDDLRKLFRRMAKSKGDIAADLSTAVRALGESPNTDGTFSGTLRKLYAEARTKFAADADMEYVAQLEEFEDRILHAFEHAVTMSKDPNVREIADRYFSSVKKDHNLMRDLKKNRATAPPR